MASDLNKHELLELVIASLKSDLQLLIDASITAKAAATDAEAKPENKYDTRGLEQSYLAAGQAKRANDLKESIEALRSFSLQKLVASKIVEVGSVVYVNSEENEESIYFILPQRGGIKLSYKGSEIATLTPDSALGEKMLEKAAGDDFELKMKNETRAFTVTKIL